MTSDSPSASSGITILPREERAKRVLVFRIGSLGDALVALPSLWVIRDNFPDAKVTLLCDRQVGKKFIVAADVFKGSGIIDDFVIYPVGGGSRLRQAARMLLLLCKLRCRHFDALVYLAPAGRESHRYRRDRRFFRLAGIKQLIGMRTATPPAPRVSGQPLRMQPREADRLLARLADDGLRVPPAGEGRMELPLGASADREVEMWLADLPPSHGRPWIVIAPGSKMPAKIWPSDRFARVVTRLIEQFDVWPIVVGGSEDRQVGEALLREWGRGYLAAGNLGLGGTAAVMARCRLYLGNDTGAMHLAVTAGVPCVAIFSSRTEPGRWYPYGDRHRVFRTAIDCEGCELMVCIERKKECICRIGVEEVLQGCTQLLGEDQHRD